MIVFSIPYVMASLVGVAVSLMKNGPHSTALIVLFPSAMVLESNTEQLPRIYNFRDTRQRLRALPSHATSLTKCAPSSSPPLKCGFG